MLKTKLLGDLHKYTKIRLTIQASVPTGNNNTVVQNRVTENMFLVP